MKLKNLTAIAGLVLLAACGKESTAPAPAAESEAATARGAP